MALVQFCHLLLFSSCKTIVRYALQEERDRQITAMRERVARVKYERTQTMKERGTTTSRQFDELVSDAGAGTHFTNLVCSDTFNKKYDIV